MAMSKYIIQAQDIVNCHLCEDEPNIKWNCVDCERLMCDKCRHKVHPKFKNAKDHKIIDIKDIGLDTGQGERNLDFTNIKCIKQHTKQACCLFCRTCDHLVCPSCVAKQHVGHQFLEIKDVYEMKVEQLKNGQSKMEKEKEQLINGNKKLDSIKSAEETKHKKVNQDVQNQREALFQAVNLYSDKLLEETDKEMKSIQFSISKEKLNVRKILKSLEDKEEQVESLIQTTDTGKFFVEVDNLGRMLDEKIAPINMIHRKIPKFVPGQFSQSSVGSFIWNIASDKNIDKVEMKVTQQFTTDIKHIVYTAVSPDGSLWICDNTSKELQNIRLDGERLTTSTSFSTFIRDIAVQSDNEVLFTDGSSKLKQISDRRTIIDSKYNVHSLRITTVHITDQKLILGAISPGPVFPVTGRRVAIVMNQSGNQEKVYENDRHNRCILSYPESITSTANENIFVVDVISEDWRGRIVVLSPDGDIFNTYNSHPEINTQELPFSPVCVVTTPSDNVLVSSLNTNFIYILNNTGYLTTQINCKDHGIINSHSMAFSTTGQLYIGTSPQTGSKYKAKLYEVELSGC